MIAAQHPAVQRKNNIYIHCEHLVPLSDGVEMSMHLVVHHNEDGYITFWVLDPELDQYGEDAYDAIDPELHERLDTFGDDWGAKSFVSEKVDLRNS